MNTAKRYTALSKMPGYVLVALLALSLSNVTHSQVNGDGPARIAVVDLEQVVAQSQPGQLLQKQLEQFQKSTTAEGEQMASQVRALQQQLMDVGASMAAEEKAAFENQIQAGVDEINQFRTDKQREGQKMQQEGLKQIEARLEPVFTEIQDQYGFDLILNNTPGIVVSAAERVNITQLAIDGLNKR